MSEHGLTRLSSNIGFHSRINSLTLSLGNAVFDTEDFAKALFTNVSIRSFALYMHDHFTGERYQAREYISKWELRVILNQVMQSEAAPRMCTFMLSARYGMEAVQFPPELMVHIYQGLIWSWKLNLEQEINKLLKARST